MQQQFRPFETKRTARSNTPDMTGIYGVAVAAFLLAICPQIIWTQQDNRKMADVPICPPDDDGQVILFPRPENCSEFYQCAGGVLFTHHCPENLYYCSEKEYCAWIFEPNCTFDCLIAKKNKVVGDDTKVTAVKLECPPQVDKNLTLIANPDNCSSYYECDNEVPVLMDCPEDLYFCTEKDTCTWVWEPGCTFDCVIVKTNPVLVRDTPAVAAIPQCPPQIGNNLTLIANPDNCSAYYECDNGVPVLMDCPESLYFCTEKEACTWVWEPGCTFDCVIVKTNPVLVRDTPAVAAIPECPPQVDKNLTLIANPDNCSAYYECDNEVPVLMDCPEDLYFCTEKETCTWVWEPGCTFDCVIVKTNPVLVRDTPVPAAIPECPPQVDKNLTLIANPDNCSSYYECDNGVPVLMDCPTGLYFCTEKETCTWIWEPDCTFDCIIVKSETSVDIYTGDVSVTNHRKEILGTKGRQALPASIKK